MSEVRCPNCSRVYRLKPEAEEILEAKCPNCRKWFRITGNRVTTEQNKPNASKRSRWEFTPRIAVASGIGLILSGLLVGTAMSLLVLERFNDDATTEQYNSQLDSEDHPVVIVDPKISEPQRVEVQDKNNQEQGQESVEDHMPDLKDEQVVDEELLISTASNLREDHQQRMIGLLKSQLGVPDAESMALEAEVKAIYLSHEDDYLQLVRIIWPQVNEVGKEFIVAVGFEAYVQTQPNDHKTFITLLMPILNDIGRELEANPVIQSYIARQK